MTATPPNKGPHLPGPPPRRRQHVLDAAAYNQAPGKPPRICFSEPRDVRFLIRRLKQASRQARRPGMHSAVTVAVLDPISGANRLAIDIDFQQTRLQIR